MDIDGNKRGQIFASPSHGTSDGSLGEPLCVPGEASRRLVYLELVISGFIYLKVGITQHAANPSCVIQSNDFLLVFRVEDKLKVLNKGYFFVMMCVRV